MVVANQRPTRLRVWQRLSADLAVRFFFTRRRTFEDEALPNQFLSDHQGFLDRLA